MRLEAFGNDAMERVLWGLGLLRLKTEKYLANMRFLRSLTEYLISLRTRKEIALCVHLQSCRFARCRNAKHDVSDYK